MDPVEILGPGWFWILSIFLTMVLGMLRLLAYWCEMDLGMHVLKVEAHTLRFRLKYDAAYRRYEEEEHQREQREKKAQHIMDVTAKAA